jgi:hypothetical protein
MKKFAEKIKSLIQFKKKTDKELINLDFVKTRKGIWKELNLSKDSGSLLGVYSPALGEGMFLTKVDDIDSNEVNEIVVFSQYDMSGRILLRNTISLDEIQMVCPFNKTYRNPILSDKKTSNKFLEIHSTSA